jgi:sRNA-binding carbon storage regulator CsrA
VRLGISAPDFITILRRELNPPATPACISPHKSSSRPMPALCR